MMVALHPHLVYHYLMPDAPRCLALCPRPTEPLCAAELAALPGVTGIEPLSGAVAFSAPPGQLHQAMYRANLHLRSATRILLSLGDFPCSGADDLYEAARSIRWEEFLAPDGTFAVAAHGQLASLNNSMFTALRVKDAIADHFRDRIGRRPDVDVRDPDVRINVQLYQTGQDGQDRPNRQGGRCALALDSSGEPLHRRGYRKEAAEAPMKETLAAAILLRASYREGTLVDPLCGSGTLVVEGGLLATRRAPGLSRRFGFQRWRTYQPAVLQALRAAAEAEILPLREVFLHGSDRDRRVLDKASRNAHAAGLAGCVRFTRTDLLEARPPPGPPGLVVCNPPYGERMGEAEQLGDLYRALGDVLKRHFTGYTAYVFTANPALSKQIGLRPKERHVLYNGNLEGRLLRFDLY